MKTHPSRFLFNGAVLAALLCGWLAVTGCRSGRAPGSASHASVEINGKSLGEVQKVTQAVFAEDGYATRLAQPNLMVFDRPGSRSDALKWGGVITGGVTMRVKVQFSSLNQTAMLLQADVFAVQDAGDSFFEGDRNIILNLRPYQKLLNEVKKRLK